MKRFAMLVIVGVAMTLTFASPASARDLSVSVNGQPFYGKWAMVDERPYVGVEAFASALGLPRIHNAKDWQLADKASGTSNPLDLVVRGPKGKLPTVRQGGVTMVDLRAAADALGLPFHYNTFARTFQVGSPYYGEAMKGAWYRWYNQRYGRYTPSHLSTEPMRDHMNDDHPGWPKGTKKKM